MKTAKLVQDLTGNGFNGAAKCFDINPPIGERFSIDENKKTYSRVIVSAIKAAFDTGQPETFIFPATEDGKDIADFGELEGSRRGICDPEGLLMELGYEIS